MSSDPNNNNNRNNDHVVADHDVASTKKREYAEDVDLWNRLRRVCTIRLDEMSKTGTYQMGEAEKEMIQQLHSMGLKEGVVAGICTMIILRRGPVILSRFLYKRQMQNQQRTTTGQQQHSSSSSSSSSTYQLSAPPNLPPPSSSSGSGGSSTNNPFQRAAAQSQQSQQQQGSSLPPPPQPPTFEQWQTPRPRSWILRSVFFCVDLSISLLAAASISMSYTDTPKIQKQLEELPLIQGRSLVADAFCDSLELELDQVRHEKHPSYERVMAQKQQNGQRGKDLQFSSSSSSNISGHEKSNEQQQQLPLSNYLESILIFVEHCQRRRAVEQDIRQSRGLGGRNHQNVGIEIPPPGVPRNGPRLALVEEGGGEGNESDTDFGSNDGDWSTTSGGEVGGGGNDEAMMRDEANRFVMDQGEDNESQRRKNNNGGEKPKRGWW